ncbi:hypothetical protein BGZ70_001186 [Mortierella alpina]|uniref:Uncharacterized protein n=1 Tax=Mortierella alpina TaxID=64518 RepID=A0A9P6LYC3_MORAP|nr:hypothetical protein BGZ70_001186 [Mortierella alpina]
MLYRRDRHTVKRRLEEDSDGVHLSRSGLTKRSIALLRNLMNQNSKPSKTSKQGTPVSKNKTTGEPEIYL